MNVSEFFASGLDFLLRNLYSTFAFSILCGRLYFEWDIKLTFIPNETQDLFENSVCARI